MFNFLTSLRSGGGPGATRTVRPVRTLGRGRAKPLLEFATATLNRGVCLAEAVRTPLGESLLEWLATGTCDAYNTLMLCWGMVAEGCTCTCMSAGKVSEPLGSGAGLDTADNLRRGGMSFHPGGNLTPCCTSI